MADRRSVNRSMFWRLVRKSVFANRGRLLVILLALGAGAAITAALLNLQVDAKQRVTTEFSTFGPNVVITARGSNDSSTAGSTLPESAFQAVPTVPINEGGKDAVLYVLSKARGYRSERAIDAIVVGTKEEGAATNGLPAITEISPSISKTEPNCWLGVKAATQLRAHPADRIVLTANDRTETCHVVFIVAGGSEEDGQIFLSLESAQRLARLPGQIHAIKLRVPGSPQQIASRIDLLRQRLPDAEIRPIRQLTEGEARLYLRISGILTATIAVVLVLTALCVMAAMTNVAMERKNDVGLMKAIGGSVRRVLRLFLAEAALLGLAGGLIGAAVGIVISMGLGKAVFGVAAQPRLVVYPVSVGLTVIVAILAAYPLRRLVHIRPASVFRGEE